MYVSSSFRKERDEICPLLEYYAAYSGNSLPTFIFILDLFPFLFLDFLTLENGTDRLGRNHRLFFPGFLDAWKWDWQVVPKSSRIFSWISWRLKMGLTGYAEIIAYFFLDFLTLENGTDRLCRNHRVLFPGFLDAWKWDWQVVPKSSRIFSWISWRLKMGQIGCPETSTRNYHYMLRNIPQERRFQQCISTSNMKQSFEHKSTQRFEDIAFQ